MLLNIVKTIPKLLCPPLALIGCVKRILCPICIV